MTKKEREFMHDLAELMAKYQVSIEATTWNNSVSENPSIQIQDPNAEMDIDLYGCLYPDDIIRIAKTD